MRSLILCILLGQALHAKDSQSQLRWLWAGISPLEHRDHQPEEPAQSRVGSPLQNPENVRERVTLFFHRLSGPLALIQNEVRRPPRTDPRRIHDPSTLRTEGDHTYFISTGRGLPVVKENARGEWLHAGRIFSEDQLPAWHRELVPGNTGHLWAPDVIKLGETYFLYYSVSTFGSQISAIGLATGKSLDPDSPDWAWKDRGPVITSSKNDPYNAIDPAIFRDDDGSLWMSYGSFWKGIYLTPLDPKTGLLLDRKAAPVHLASAAEIEAPFIHKRNGFYYLFLNHGLCCRGVNSTYEIRVGRSKSLAGPYLDREGKDLRNGGGTLLMESEGDHIGPGHPSITTRNGREYLAHHFYDGAERGQSRFALAPLTWEENWPKIAASGDPQDEK